MPLQEPVLDNLRFQKDFVDEARRRIIRYCPEWTEYNLSDPGITLIELFSWMAESIVYRLNLVPEKNYIQFLELLGTKLRPAASARVELTFRLSTPFPIRPGDETVALVPKGIEVATQVSAEEREEIFTTDERLEIIPPQLICLRRNLDFNTDYLPRLKIRPCSIFGSRPPKEGKQNVGDTFYLGFADKDLSGHILQLRFGCEAGQAAGIRPKDAPVVWECSTGNGEWQRIYPSEFPGEEDMTDGFNSAEGQVIFYLPLGFKPDYVQGRFANWLRCRFEKHRPDQRPYTQSPHVQWVEVFTLGATTRATHAVVMKEELVGHSNGEPGQVFHLRHSPVLVLEEGENLEIEEEREGEPVFVPWQLVVDFSNSDEFSRHFTLDNTGGEVGLGPCIRQPDGGTRQYGRVPGINRRIRFSRYRYGGGIAGNVPAKRIRVLKTAVPYINEVVNLKTAMGGQDAETLEEAKMRARREIHAQQRAVTCDDYEILAEKADDRIARVKCIAPSHGNSLLPPGTVELLVVPAAFDGLKLGDLTRLQLDSKLEEAIHKYLEKYRLLTTTLRVREPRYLGIEVSADVVASEYTQPELLGDKVIARLENFISPLVLDKESAAQSDLMGPGWKGWPFGRSVFVAEIYALIQKVPGVKHVLDVRVKTRPVIPIQEIRSGEEEPGGGQPSEADKSLVVLEDKRIDLPVDMLPCSLKHKIKLVEL